MGSQIPGLLNINDGVAGFINIHPQMYQSVPEEVIDLIILAVKQIVQSETESKDHEQLKNELERIIDDGTDNNGNDEQSEHSIEPKHFINGNDGLRKNNSGTQLQATVKREANPEIEITKISVNTPPHNVNNQMDSEETVAGRNCRQQPTIMDTKTIRQSITLARKTITSKPMI
ncbi:MAG: hypothetical protein EZS28_045811, partial [Streblomastix strix]